MGRTPTHFSTRKTQIVFGVENGIIAIMASRGYDPKKMMLKGIECHEEHENLQKNVIKLREKLEELSREKEDGGAAWENLQKADTEESVSTTRKKK